MSLYNMRKNNMVPEPGIILLTMYEVNYLIAVNGLAELLEIEIDYYQKWIELIWSERLPDHFYSTGKSGQVGRGCDCHYIRYYSLSELAIEFLEIPEREEIFAWWLYRDRLKDPNNDWSAMDSEYFYPDYYLTVDDLREILTNKFGHDGDEDGGFQTLLLPGISLASDYITDWQEDLTDKERIKIISTKMEEEIRQLGG